VKSGDLVDGGICEGSHGDEIIKSEGQDLGSERKRKRWSEQ
jgi:hypothetical protein